MSIGLRSTCSSCSWGLNEPSCLFPALGAPNSSAPCAFTFRAQKPLLTKVPERNSTSMCSPSEGCLRMNECVHALILIVDHLQCACDYTGTGTQGVGGPVLRGERSFANMRSVGQGVVIICAC